MVINLIGAALLTMVLGLWISAAWTAVSLRSRMWVEKTEGVVVGGRSWGETHVTGSSSGGGGYIGPFGGHIDSPVVSITSDVSDAHQFFVQPLGGGHEIPVIIRPGSAFMTREGHHVVLLHLHSKKAMKFWGALNRQTGKRFWSDRTDFALEQLSWLTGLLLLLVLLTFIGLMAVAGPYAVAAYLGREDGVSEAWYFGILTGFAALLLGARILHSATARTATRVLRRKLRDAGGL